MTVMSRKTIVAMISVVVLLVVMGTLYERRILVRQASDSPLHGVERHSDVEYREVSRLMDRIENARILPGLLQRWSRRLKELEDDERSVLVDRMIDHCVTHPGYSPYLSALRDHAQEVVDNLVKRELGSHDAQRVASIVHILLTSYGNDGLTEQNRTVLMSLLRRLLLWKLFDAESAEPEAIMVRTKALGTALKIEDPALLPEIEELAIHERNINLQELARRLATILAEKITVPR